MGALCGSIVAVLLRRPILNSIQHFGNLGYVSSKHIYCRHWISRHHTHTYIKDVAHLPLMVNSPFTCTPSLPINLNAATMVSSIYMSLWHPSSGGGGRRTCLPLRDSSNSTKRSPSRNAEERSLIGWLRWPFTHSICGSIIDAGCCCEYSSSSCNMVIFGSCINSVWGRAFLVCTVVVPLPLLYMIMEGGLGRIRRATSKDTVATGLEDTTGATHITLAKE